MRELRQNIITRDWVIISSDRAKRPDEFARKRNSAVVLASYSVECPFCLGNERETAKESFVISDEHGWRVRVVPNKFSALLPNIERVRMIQGVFRSMSSVGVQEVIIEHPLHNMAIALMTVEHVADILRAYKQRYASLRGNPQVEAIIIFKNHGEAAGTSLLHPHSQLVATPIVPSQFRERVDEAIRYFDDTGNCVFCTTLAEESQARERVIEENGHFVAFIPYAALSPFHTWIFPRRHASSFDDLADEEIESLAAILRNTLARLHFGLGNPDYNYSIRSIPTAERPTEYFHWYLTIIPRITKTAGFELGSGMFINSSVPEEDAALLRSVDLLRR